MLSDEVLACLLKNNEKLEIIEQYVDIDSLKLSDTDIQRLNELEFILTDDIIIEQNIGVII